MDVDGVKVEVQVAARDADTRKLVNEMGKRHKWLAADISTNRHLSCVASFILRHLGLDSHHQVILYPDSSVHSHLQNTPVNWGPNFDRAVPLRDIYKIFGAPAKLHFLYHLITPEALSPPSKSTRTAGAGHQHSAASGAGQQLLQPKQLGFRQQPAMAPWQAQQQHPQAKYQQHQHQLHPVSSAYSQQEQPRFVPHQLQQQDQQLCQPLLDAQQQMPLQHLQNNRHVDAAWRLQQQSVSRHVDDNPCSAASDWQPQMYQQQVHLTLQQPSLPAGRCGQQQPGVRNPHQIAVGQEQQQQRSSLQWHQQDTACLYQQSLSSQQPCYHPPQSVPVVDGIISSHHGLGLQQLPQQHQDVPCNMMPALFPAQPQAGPSCAAAYGQTQQQAPSSQGLVAARQQDAPARPSVHSASFPHQSLQSSSGPAQLQADVHQAQQQQACHGQLPRVHLPPIGAGQGSRPAAGLHHPAVSNINADFGPVALANLGGQQPVVTAQGQLTQPLPAQQLSCAASEAGRAVSGGLGAQAAATACAPVRLALRTADGQDIDLPLTCSTENGRMVLLPQSNPSQSQACMPMSLPSAAQLLALLGVGGFGVVPTVGSTAPVLQPSANMGAINQQQEAYLSVHRLGAAEFQPRRHEHQQMAAEHQQQQHARMEEMGSQPWLQQHHLIAQQQCHWQQQRAVHCDGHQLQCRQEQTSDQQPQLYQCAGPATSGLAAAVAVEGGGLSISAAPVSSAMVSGSALHSTAVDRLRNGACENSRSAASPADVRSHCSSVSCGATGADRFHMHGSSRLAAGGINGSNLADVGGSATRSSLPRPDPEVSGGAADLEQQQLAGRGGLQPRQLQMHQHPSKPRLDDQMQLQQQWQPQLQCISEHHDAAAADATDGAAAAAYEGAADVAVDGNDTAGTEDGSGELQLRLDDSGEDRLQQQPKQGVSRPPAVDADRIEHYSQGRGATDCYQADYDAAYSPQHSEEQHMELQKGDEQHLQQPHAQPQQQQEQPRLQIIAQHCLQGSQTTHSPVHHDQSSRQQSQQQDSQSQGCSLQQSHSGASQQLQQQRQQQQQQDQLLRQGSMVSDERKSKATKRPLAMCSYPSINSVSTSMPAFMQPPPKRAAPASRQRRISVQPGRLPAGMRLPAEDALLALPSVISKGSSFAGTWHRSSGCWDSRVEQTPLRPDDLAGGSIFLAADLLRQRQQVPGAGAGSGVSISSKPDGSNAPLGGARAVSTQQQKQGPSSAAAGGSTNCQGTELKQHDFPHQHQRAMSQRPGPSSGPASNPGSTSLQGWCGAAGAGAAAISTDRAPCDSAATADGHNTVEEGEEVAGEQVDAVSIPQQQCPGTVQQPALPSSAAMQRVNQIPQKGSPEEPQQGISQHQWEGFQAAAPPADVQPVQTPETVIEEQQQQHHEAAAVGAGIDSMLLDYEGMAAMINGQSLMDVRQSSQIAALLQQPEPVAQPTADGGGGVTMHEALKAAGIIPPSPPPSDQELRAAAAAGAELPAVPVEHFAAEHPEPQQQHNGAGYPAEATECGAVADNGLLLFNTPSAPAGATPAVPNAEQGPGVPAACAQVAADQSLAVAAGMITRRRAAALSGPSTSAAASEGGSAGDEHISSGRQTARGQQRQGNSANSTRKGAGRGNRWAATKCRAPLPSVEQVMKSGLTSGSTGMRPNSDKPASKVPLPPADALPAILGSGTTHARGGINRALLDVVTAPAPPATAAPAAGNGGLQRFTLPNGQTVYLAPPEPGAAASGQARPPLQLELQQQALLRQQQQPVGHEPNMHLLQQQLLQQQALQLAMLQQQQQQLSAGVSTAGTHIATSAAAPTSQAPSAPASVSAAAPTAAELAAAVNRLGHGLSVGAGGTGVSGLITPGFLSPTDLLSPVAGAAGTRTAGDAALGTTHTLDSLEALLVDKDFAFFSPEKSNPLAMFNNSLAGMASCLYSPFQHSPLPAAKCSRQATALQAQQPAAAATAEQTGGVAEVGGGNTTADLEVLFHTFRDSADAPGLAPAAAAAAAAAGGSKASMPLGAAVPTAGDAGVGPADQHEVAGADGRQVDELCQYLMPNGGGDSWLVPPASAAGRPPAAQPVAAQTATACAAAAAHAATGSTRGAKRSRALQQPAAAVQAGGKRNSNQTATRVVSKENSSKAGHMTANTNRAVADRGQQHVGRVEQQSRGSSFNPSKPFAALFPSNI